MSSTEDSADSESMESSQRLKEYLQFVKEMREEMSSEDSKSDDDDDDEEDDYDYGYESKGIYSDLFLCPPSKKWWYIALHMSVGKSVSL